MESVDNYSILGIPHNETKENLINILVSDFKVALNNIVFGDPAGRAYAERAEENKKRKLTDYLKKTKVYNIRAFAQSWWKTLPTRVKWDLFYKYNPEIGNAPANIGLNLDDVEDDHINEIYIAESPIYLTKEMMDDYIKYYRMK